MTLRRSDTIGFFWEMGKSSVKRLEVDAEVLHVYASTLHAEGCNELAILAVDGSLALEPDNAGCSLFRDFLVGKLAEGEPSTT